MATPVADLVLLPPVDSTNGTLSDEFLAGLVQRGAWQFSGAQHVLTYSFNLNGPGGDPTAWDSGTSGAFVHALTAWSNVADISFQQISSGTYYFESGADIAATLTGDNLQDVFEGAIALGFFPDPDFADLVLPAFLKDRTDYPHPEGDIFFDNLYSGFSFLYDGGFGLASFLHEIGHALGLKHPHDDGGNDDDGNDNPTFPALGISLYDSGRWTVMSYNDGVSVSSGHDASPMPLDILAIQHIYGANMAYHAGGDLYVLAPDFNNPYSTIWDAGGNDTIDASAYAQGMTIDLRPGYGYVQGIAQNDGLTAIAFNVTIEAAIGGAFDDTITGNDASNVLSGGAGNDLISGTGGDTLAGGAGDDSFVVEGPDVVVLEGDGGGMDLVRSSVSYALGANLENLALTGSGNIGGTGNALNNVLTGNAGANLLDGGSGADTMNGGAGNDTYMVDNPGDVVGEESSGGDADLIIGSVSVVLGDGVENVTLTGGSNLDVTANSLNNVLAGNDGVNVLTGGGGNDTYIVQNTADQAVEQFGQGTDLVQSTVSFTLSTNVENLELGGSGAIDGHGNGLANALTGNAGDNVLDGGEGADTLSGGAGNDFLDGGTGFDRMAGGAGNDTYVVGDSVPLSGENMFSSVLTLSGPPGSFANGSTLTFDNLSGSFGYNFIDFTGDGLVDTMTLLYHDTNFANLFIVDLSTRSLGENFVAGTTYTDAMRYPFEDPGHPGLWIAGNGSGANQSSGSFTVLAAEFADGLGGPQLQHFSVSFDYQGDGPPLTGTLTADILITAGNSLFEPVIEQPDGGIDTVLTSLSYALGANVENLSLAGVDGIDGTGNAGNNFITGNSGKNVLDGGAGDDSVSGGSGNDQMLGGLGNDVLHGNVGADTLAGDDGDDQLLGDNGNDAIAGGTGDDTINGNNGLDTIDGGSGNDSIHGGQQGDVIEGGDGNDQLFGDLGDDSISGGTGNDAVQGGAGNDSLRGNQGADTVAGDDGDDQLLGDNGNDSIAGGTGDDDINGNNGLDTIDGGIGNDIIHGGLNPDVISGGDGNDQLFGDLGDDTLAGGAGHDTLAGGLGSDVFRYDAASPGTDDVTSGGHDVITDAVGELISLLGLTDDLQVAGIFLNAFSSDMALGDMIDAGNSVAFAEGVLRIDVDGDHAFVSENDFQVTLTGVMTVTCSADGLFHLA